MVVEAAVMDGIPQEEQHENNGVRMEPWETSEFKGKKEKYEASEGYWEWVVEGGRSRTKKESWNDSDLPDYTLILISA